MRKSLAWLIVCLLAVASHSLAATKGEWTGWLSDAKCAANGAKESHKGCTLKCIDAGQSMVFVKEDDKKVFKLENAEKAKSLAGERVKLSGVLEGDTIKIDSATPAGN
ncbi:MAG: hypothetical protein U0V70_19235 [Terriglobia bacterium]